MVSLVCALTRSDASKKPLTSAIAHVPGTVAESSKQHYMITPHLGLQSFCSGGLSELQEISNKKKKKNKVKIPICVLVFVCLFFKLHF